MIEHGPSTVTDPTDIDPCPAWESDLAVLERLVLLRQWEPPEPRPRRTPDHPQFGGATRRARPDDPPADLTLSH
jgi:hypothetical protein